MAMMTTSQWGDFVTGVKARVNEIIDETKNLEPSFKQSGLWKTEQSDGLIYTTQGVVGLGLLERKDEDGKIKYDRTYPAYRTEYTIVEVAKGVEISQMLAKTRPSELEAKLDEVKQLRISASKTLNEWAWRTLIDGFVTTDSSSSFPISRLDDGVSMFSTSHPSKVPGVAVRSNRLSGDPILSPSSLFNAVKQIKEQLNGRGLPISPEGKFVLVVPTALEKTAIEITNSVLVSDSAENAINYFKGSTDVISTNLIGANAGGSDTAWYVFFKDEMNSSMRYVTLVEPIIEQDTDFETKSIKVSVYMACAFGYSNFEYCVASDGTND